MFRPMRRKAKEISPEAAKELLRNERRGVLAVNGDEGYPYAIPINYFYAEKENKIYFHGAKAGHKVDSLRKDDKICFTVYGNEQMKDVPWAPYVQSAVVFGRCRLLEDSEESRNLCRIFASKYYPTEELIEEEMEKAAKALQVYEIEIEHMTGKEIQER